MRVAEEEVAVGEEEVVSEVVVVVDEGVGEVAEVVVAEEAVVEVDTREEELRQAHGTVLDLRSFLI